MSDDEKKLSPGEMVLGLTILVVLFAVLVLLCTTMYYATVAATFWSYTTAGFCALALLGEIVVVGKALNQSDDDE